MILRCVFVSVCLYVCVFVSIIHYGSLTFPHLLSVSTLTIHYPTWHDGTSHSKYKHKHTGTSLTINNHTHTPYHILVKAALIQTQRYALSVTLVPDTPIVVHSQTEFGWSHLLPKKGRRLRWWQHIFKPCVSTMPLKGRCRESCRGEPGICW